VLTRNIRRFIWNCGYRATICALRPLNLLLIALRKKDYYPNSVLHVSYMVHIPYFTVHILRTYGMKADYMAVGTSDVWNKCDFQVTYSSNPIAGALRSFLVFWRVVAKYEIIHSHFMLTMSPDGWELPVLKKLGRKIVVHYRGCEARQRTKNMQLHPDMNICQECDYDTYCEDDTQTKRRSLARKYGDLFLVTTPDLKDFVPDAVHQTFFAPDIAIQNRTERQDQARTKIVHATNHPGIEGTSIIRETIDRLNRQGYSIDFVFLKGVPYERVLEEYRTADIAIGKMKMGYYANGQIESMTMGVPTITYVRPEFMTDELRQSGFIFSDPEQLEETLKYYLDNPQELDKKRKIARSSILGLHDNDRLARQLIEIYGSLRQRMAV
jgi:hypothetical protein